MRIPAKHLSCAARVSDELSGVTRSPLRSLNRKWSSGDLFNSGDDLRHGKPGCCSKVECAQRLIELRQGQEVSISQIDHMDIIPNGGSIRRRVVSAEDSEHRPLPQDRL